MKEQRLDCPYDFTSRCTMGRCDCKPKEEPKPHSFCETPEEKCTMNYCDENGCQNRKRELVEPKQETLEPIVYNIGDNIRIINPTENQPKLFTTHKVDNDFGVVYYYQLDGKEESIGFSYIKKEEPKQQTLEEAAEKIYLNYENNDLLYGHSEELQLAYKAGIVDGAKWQQEQIFNLIKELHDNENITGFSKLSYAKCLDIIEQFKKK